MTTLIDLPRTSTHHTQAATERRRVPRAKLVTELNLYSGSNFYAGFTEDVSEGGVFVATYAMLPIGAKVALELGLPGGLTIEATGTVRWLRDCRTEDESTEPPGMGIEFDGITDEARALIREFVENRSPYFFDDKDD